jgi:hypothetical protein
LRTVIPRVRRKHKAAESRTHSLVRWPHLSFLLIGLGLTLHAAEPAAVTFSLDFPGSDPAHYSVAVRSDGHASYKSNAKISDDSTDTEDYQTEFVVSDRNRALIFELAARAHFFSGKVDSGNKKLAFAGAKKLTYSDGTKTTSADYNYSQQPAVQQLTALFEGISATLEFGRRLAFDHRYQKLALEEELSRMESEAKSGELVELQAVQPILQAIFDDTSVMNVTRARAQRIMEMVEKPSSAR